MQAEKKVNLFHHTKLVAILNLNLVKKLVFNGFKKCTSYNYLNRYVVHVHNNHMIAKSKLCMILRIFFDHFLLHYCNLTPLIPTCFQHTDTLHDTSYDILVDLPDLVQQNSNMSPTFGISLKIWFHFCEVPSGTL